MLMNAQILQATQCSFHAARLKETIDARLKALAPAVEGSDTLGQAVRYTLVAPGKRLRPLLTVLTTEEFDVDPADALDAGCALEMVHAASLIFDDLPSMDDSPLRRGRPSTHVAFGEDVAILAGVSLMALAYGTAASAAGLDGEKRANVVKILANAVGTDGLAGGQLADLRRCGQSGVAGISRANHLKTGILFVAAVEMAATVAGVRGRALEEKRRFAAHLGQAFQILDDLSDAVEPDATSAIDRSRPTISSILGHAAARHRLHRHTTVALECVRPGGALAELVAGLFDIP